MCYNRGLFEQNDILPLQKKFYESLFNISDRVSKIDFYTIAFLLKIQECKIFDKNCCALGDRGLLKNSSLGLSSTIDP
jgi:hypothetical protein